MVTESVLLLVGRGNSPVPVVCFVHLYLGVKGGTQLLHVVRPLLPLSLFPFSPFPPLQSRQSELYRTNLQASPFRMCFFGPVVRADSV